MRKAKTHVKRISMFLLIIAVFLSAVPLSSGTVSAVSNSTIYYIAADGTGDGLSESTPMSFAQANSATFEGGDKILFRRGDIFYGRFSPITTNIRSTSRVEFGAYGSGELPIISRAKIVSRAWTDAGTIEDKHFYKYDISETGVYSGLQDGTVNVGFMEDSNGVKYGIRRKTAAECVNEYDFYCDTTGGQYVYVYTDTDPYEFLGTLKFNAYGTAFLMPSNAVIHDIHVADAGYGFTRKSGNTESNKNIHIYDCVIENIGGIYGLTNNNTEYSTKAGNGIEFYGQAYDCVVEHNLFRDIYDVGFTCQGNSPSIWQNVIVRNNVFAYCTQAIEIWSGSSDEGSGVDRLDFVNNLCIGGGESWGTPARGDHINVCDVLTYGYESPVWRMNLSNNTYYHAVDYSTVYSIASVSLNAFLTKNITADNNYFYIASQYETIFRSQQNNLSSRYENTRVYVENNKTISDMDLTGWQLISGMDTNSTFTLISDLSKYSSMEAAAKTLLSVNEIVNAAKTAGLTYNFATTETTGTNILPELELTPSVYTFNYQFSWNDTEPSYDECTLNAFTVGSNTSGYWDLLYDGVTDSSAGNVGGFAGSYYQNSNYNSKAWNRRIAMMYDLGDNYKLFEIALISRSKDRSFYRYSVYGSTQNENLLDAANLLGRYFTDTQNTVAITDLDRDKNVRYVLIVFDCVANDPGNTTDVDSGKTTYTDYTTDEAQSVISSDRLTGNMAGIYYADGGIYIQEVELIGKESQDLVSVLNNGTDEANTDAKVYTIAHTLDWTDTAPNYSNDSVTEITSLSSAWKSYGTYGENGTFAAAPTTAKEYASILADGTDLYNDTAKTRKNEVWVGTSANNTSNTTRRVALLYDLGAEYELTDVILSIPYKHFCDNRYIYAFSVYGGHTADVAQILKSDRIGSGGGTIAQVTATITSIEPVRYLLITFDQLGSDYSYGEAGATTYTDKARCSSSDGLAYLTEICVNGYPVENQPVNILANNEQVTLYSYNVSAEFDWTKAHQDYSESTAVLTYGMQKLNSGTNKQSVAANDVTSNLTNGIKSNFFEFTEADVNSDNSNDIYILGANRSSVTETRQAVMVDLGGYYVLDSMTLFSTPKRFSDGRYIYEYTVFAGNSSDANDLLKSTNVSYGSSRTASIGNEFTSADSVRYLLIVLDRVGTDPSADYYGNANTLTVKNNSGSNAGLVYLTELEIYGTKNS